MFDHIVACCFSYATVHNVKDHTIEDRMESFFLAETTKYLYLLFDPDNFIHNSGQFVIGILYFCKGNTNIMSRFLGEWGRLIDTPSGKCVINTGGYVFNTEAHPIDPSITYCCSRQRQEDLEKIRNFE